MNYFNENMSVDNARKLMFQLTVEMKDEKSALKEMWDEYDNIRPILYEKEFNSPDHMNVMTS